MSEGIYVIAWLSIIGLVAGWVICLAIGTIDLACAIFARIVKSVS